MELKKKHLKTVHQKLRVFRAKDPMLSVFMWGINYSVSYLTYHIDFLCAWNIVANVLYVSKEFDKLIMLQCSICNICNRLLN